MSKVLIAAFLGLVLLAIVLFVGWKLGFITFYYYRIR
jgi:hypothetical protein